MATLAEDLEAFVTLHRRFKSGELGGEELLEYEALRLKVEAALRPEPPPGQPPRPGRAGQRRSRIGQL